LKRKSSKTGKSAAFARLAAFPFQNRLVKKFDIE
jgi:hypothetical protein